MGWFWLIVIIVAIIVLKKTLKKAMSDDVVEIKHVKPNKRKTVRDPLSEYPSPLPLKKLKTIDIGNKTFYIAWSGSLPETTFSVNRKEKVTITPTHILVKGLHPYIAQIKDGEQVIYSKKSISSQIKTVGKGAKPFYDWLRTFHDFPYNFEHMYPER